MQRRYLLEDLLIYGRESKNSRFVRTLKGKSAFLT